MKARLPVAPAQAGPPLDDPVLEREWLVVARSDEVGDEPHRVAVLGRALVLWRGPAGLVAFKDLCIHRGSALSLGRVVDGELECPYHGWRYDGSGACTRIPAQPPGRGIPTKARAFRHECREVQGLVWVRLRAPDDGSRPHPPRLREADDDDYRTVVCGPYRLDAEAPRVIENFLDVSHLMWVHEGYLGVPDHAEVNDYAVERSDDRLVSTPIDVYQPDPDGRGHGVTNRYVYEILRPLVARFRKEDHDADGRGSGEIFAMSIQVTPVGPRASVAYALLARNYALEAPDARFVEFQDTIMAQDERIVVSQRPELLPLDLQAELHLTSDRLALAYRSYLADSGVRTGVA